MCLLRGARSARPYTPSARPALIGCGREMVVCSRDELLTADSTANAPQLMTHVVAVGVAEVGGLIALVNGESPHSLQAFARATSTRMRV
eukprot:CAMPEP_0184394618 /NCGR_PEP_ID=MMETSP0007-20130409/40181_1 /TAXON_ID=97485 /ORGANISM="Prymnesium parvum, Strain Texoma1" /LENGTH=88 /DNA_ID=CAMNT_0026746269 /DNA_START=234 /DNA_END=496 /DNA_ORIENTATION=+